jgi:outer membrane biosynthesis protein TonB
MARTYRTAQGRQVDMERLRLQNETTPAIGNMKVNARGDQLGPGGKVVQTREEMLDQYYKKTTNRKANMPDEIPTGSDAGGRVKEIEPDDFVDPPEPNAEPDPIIIEEKTEPVEVKKENKAPAKKKTTPRKRTAKKKETATVEEPAVEKAVVPPSLKEADPIAESTSTDDSEVELGKKDKNSGLQGGESHIKGGLAKAIAKTREYEQRMGRGKPKRI